MRWAVGVFAISLLSCGVALAGAADGTLDVPLVANAGTPLRLYLNKRVRFRERAPVSAKLIAPIWTFDRISVPAGSVIEGHIAALQPVPRLVQTMAFIRGDFTPLKIAQVDFNRVVTPDGRTYQIVTGTSIGLGSIYTEPKPPKAPKKSRAPASGKRGQIERLAKQQAQAAVNSRTRGLFGLVHAPNRKEWLENFLLAKLPYHPVWYPRGERFDAFLRQPLEFGTAEIPRREIEDADPAQLLSASLRLTDDVSSADAKNGDPVHAVLAEPVFSADHRLMLPEGTAFAGKVTLARRARMFHRGGQLRFTFTQITETPEVLGLVKSRAQRTHAQMDAVEQGDHHVAVDEEGTAKATESRTRFLRPLVAGLVAAKSLDNDEGKVQATGANANYSGRALGGFSGFGLLGISVLSLPKPVGSALGFYGLTWSVYSAVLSKGREVAFDKGTAIEVRFGER